jgi:hypothetical protein
MSSTFDKYFNNIQNKESRLYRRLQDLDDLIYDKYFNAFAGKSLYIAEVLSDTNEVASTGAGSNSTLFMPIRVRIDGIHTNQIPDPYDEVKNLKGEEAVTKFGIIVLSHPLAFPDTEIYSDSAVSQPLNRGDRIEVAFIDEGPQKDGRQRGLRYRKVVEPAIARTIPTGYSDIGGAFDQKDTASVGDGAGIENPEILNNAPSLKTRVEQLIPILQEGGYNEKIKITSAKRSIEGQINVMMGNLFSGDKWHPSAKTWINETYIDQGVRDLVSDNFDNNPNISRADFKVILGNYVRPNISKISSHPAGNAIDIATKNRTYANILVLRVGLDLAVKRGLIKSYKWEYIDGSGFTKNKEKRKTVLKLPEAPQEHIHITFNKLKAQ